MAKPTEQLITDLFNLGSKTSADMDKMLPPTGTRSMAIFMQIRAKKLAAEQSAERLAKFQAQIAKGFTADDLEAVNGMIGFKKSVLSALVGAK